MHTCMYHGHVHLHPHPSYRQPLCLPQSPFHYPVSLVAVLLMGVLLIFLEKFDDSTIRMFCFQMHNTGPFHFQSHDGQPFIWFSSRAEQDQRFHLYSREENKILISYISTSQTSVWLVALNCDNLYHLNQSCIKLSICTAAQNCTMDLAIS